jgi:hypothetical protein
MGHSCAPTLYHSLYLCSTSLFCTRLGNTVGSSPLCVSHHVYGPPFTSCAPTLYHSLYLCPTSLFCTRLGNTVGSASPLLSVSRITCLSPLSFRLSSCAPTMYHLSLCVRGPALTIIMCLTSLIYACSCQGHSGQHEVFIFYLHLILSGVQSLPAQLALA